MNDNSIDMPLTRHNHSLQTLDAVISLCTSTADDINSNNTPRFSDTLDITKANHRIHLYNS